MRWLQVDTLVNYSVQILIFWFAHLLDGLAKAIIE
jgi:hypothetical protein